MNQNIPNGMYKNLGTIIIFTVVIICGFLIYNNRKENTISHTDNSDRPNSTSQQSEGTVTYSIINIEINNKVKTIASVLISKKIPEFELRSLATKIKSDINPVSNRVRLFFLLPGMTMGNGAWARADFNPDLRVDMIEQSIETENKMADYKATLSDSNFIGLWNANLSGDFIYRLKRGPNDKFTLDFYSPSENSSGPLPALLKKTKIKGKIAFRDIDEPNEYYIIESNGDLSAFDERGYITSYRKL